MPSSSHRLTLRERKALMDSTITRSDWFETYLATPERWLAPRRRSVLPSHVLALLQGSGGVSPHSR
jgi:hypothetical protein